MSEIAFYEPGPEREPELVYLRADDGYHELSRLAPGDVLVISGTEYVVGDVQPTVSDATLPRFTVNVEHEHRWIAEQAMCDAAETRRCACGAVETEDRPPDDTPSPA